MMDFINRQMNFLLSFTSMFGLIQNICQEWLRKFSTQLLLCILY